MADVDPVLAEYLQTVWHRGASDLHLTVGFPPALRIDGAIVPIAGEGLLKSEDVARMVRSLLSEERWGTYYRRRQVDFSFSWRGVGRFRGNAYHQRSSPALSLRAVPFEIRRLETLGAPPVLEQLYGLPQGLVLCVGPTGSGKSTTLAALIDRINDHRTCHVITIEDPIEYLHRHRRSIINQREVGEDTPTFADGLRAALREDPDVLMVGEMRDSESIAITLTLAETGHLVFATLHTNDAAQALDRIVDVFPAERRDQIQIQLAATLQAVVSQRLLPRIGGGRVAAFEVLLANEAVRNLIREGKTRQLRNTITTGRQEGMQLLEHDLNRLLHTGQIAPETARQVTSYPKELETRPGGTPMPRAAAPGTRH